jgi:hypothetical protein
MESISGILKSLKIPSRIYRICTRKQVISNHAWHAGPVLIGIHASSLFMFLNSRKKPATARSKYAKMMKPLSIEKGRAVLHRDFVTIL